MREGSALPSPGPLPWGCTEVPLWDSGMDPVACVVGGGAGQGAGAELRAEGSGAGASGHAPPRTGRWGSEVGNVEDRKHNTQILNYFPFGGLGYFIHWLA